MRGTTTRRYLPFYPPLCRSTGGLPRRRQRCTKPWFATGLSARTTSRPRPQLGLSLSDRCLPPTGLRPIGRPSLFTVCHPQPSPSATSSTGRPCRPTWTVAHLAAREVNNARCGVEHVGPSRLLGPRSATSGVVGECRDRQRYSVSDGLGAMAGESGPSASPRCGRSPPRRP